MDQLKTTMSDSPILPQFQEYTLQYQIFRSLEDALSKHDTQKALAIVQWAAASQEGVAILRQPWEHSQTALTLVLNQEKYPDLPPDPTLVKALLDLEVPVNPTMSQPFPLLSALRSGNLTVVQMLLEHGAKLDSNYYYPAREPDPFATIVLAIESGSAEVALYLIRNFSDSELIKSAHWPLRAAARYGELQVFQALVDVGIDINYQGSVPEKHVNYNDTDTALMEAAKVDNNPILPLLLSMGADINARNNYNQTALNYAATPQFRGLHPKPGTIGYQSYAPANVQRLLKYGVDSGTLSNILYSVQPGYVIPQQSAQVAAIVKLLLEYGADANFAPQQYTALDIALNTSEFETALLLVKAGAEITGRETKLWTLAHEGNTRTHQNLIDFLEERGVKPIATELPLLLEQAIEKGDLARTKLLIASGVNLNDGAYILEAAADGYANIVQALLEGGADPNVTNKNQYTPLMLVVHYGSKKRHSHIFDVTTAQVSSETEDLNTVRHLLAAGANPNKANEDGVTPLHLAAQYSTPDIVQLLLDSGAIVNARQKSSRTPLRRVVANGRVSRLVRANNVHALYTLMHWPELACDEYNHAAAASALEKDEKIVQILIAAGADVTDVGDDGWPILHLAALYSTMGVVQALLEAGALNSEKINPTPSGAIFYFGRTSTLFKKQKLDLVNFPWLCQELIEAARDGKNIADSVAHGNLDLQFAVRTDAAILNLLGKAGDQLTPG